MSDFKFKTSEQIKSEVRDKSCQELQDRITACIIRKQELLAIHITHITDYQIKCLKESGYTVKFNNGFYGISWD